MTSTAVTVVILLLASAIGAVLGGLFVAIGLSGLIDRRLDKAIHATLGPALADAGLVLAAEIESTVLVKDENGALRSRQSLYISGPEFTSQAVEQWLDKRGLVMAPKGADFKRPVRKEL